MIAEEVKGDNEKAVIAQHRSYSGFEVAILEATAGIIARCRQRAGEIHRVLSFSYVGCHVKG